MPLLHAYEVAYSCSNISDAHFVTHRSQQTYCMKLVT